VKLDAALRATLYACVSTRDKGQEVDNQLIDLCRFCVAQGWLIVREYRECESGGTAGRFSAPLTGGGTTDYAAFTYSIGDFVTAPVTVQGTEQAVLLDHFPQPRHDRPRRFRLHPLRVVTVVPATGASFDRSRQRSPPLPTIGSFLPCTY